MVKLERLQELFWVTLVGVNGVLFLLLAHAYWREGIFFRHALVSPDKDPPIGSSIPVSLRPLLDGRKPLLVLAFGQCSEGSLENLAGWVVMLERWGEEVTGVVVAKERQETLGEIWRKRSWKVPFIADEEGQLLRELNAYFLPRAYGFDLDGKLVFKQDDPSLTALDAIRSLVAAVRGEEYAKQVFDRKPAWAEAREGEKAGSKTLSSYQGGER